MFIIFLIGYIQAAIKLEVKLSSEQVSGLHNHAII